MWEQISLRCASRASLISSSLQIVYPKSVDLYRSPQGISFHKRNNVCPKFKLPVAIFIPACYWSSESDTYQFLSSFFFLSLELSYHQMPSILFAIISLVIASTIWIYVRIRTPRHSCSPANIPGPKSQSWWKGDSHILDSVAFFLTILLRQFQGSLQCQCMGFSRTAFERMCGLFYN